jgi:acyl transferase domain-containing protein
MKDIAMVGIACTFPGARNPSEFWENIVGKVDAIRDVSPERWDPEIFYDPEPGKEDRIYCKKGGWMPDSFTFNPLRYGIMPNTVPGAEPDHFLVLRTVYEALDDAGYLEAGPGPRERISIVLGKGNYLGPGVTALMYRGIVTEQTLAIIKGLHPDFTPEHLAEIGKALRAKLPAFSAETAAGLIPNISTGRVANRLDFMGRNFTLDAACASSLIATEIALAELDAGRADLMLAGGVHIFAHIPFLQVFDAMRALSLGSVIRPYDEGCDGTISGEGIGILVLKRLADAERDRDRIYAVIKSVGSSSDGRAKGVTAPRIEGEELALRRGYEASGIDPETLDLMEGHGTGTPAGDEAEVRALRNVLGPPRQGRPRCALGSVKSMIGHAMPAAGAAGMIKAALALYHRVLPPTLNCTTPRAELNGSDSPLYINTETRPWIRAANSTPRRAGVNAFGFGGVNAHAVLEEYVPADENAQSSLIRRQEQELFIIGAQDRVGLTTALDDLARYVAQASAVPLRDIAYSTSIEANGAVEKIAIVAVSHDDLAGKLKRAEERLSEGKRARLRDRQGIYYFGAAERGAKVAILFPGEGSQYLNMLSELCVHFPLVRKAFDVADAVGTDPERWPLSAIVYPPPFFSADKEKAAEARLFTIDRATEAVLTADCAMFEVVTALGVRPDMMAGHSAGEWVAMAASGMVDRNQLVGSMEQLGAMYRRVCSDTTIPSVAMLAVGAGRDTVEQIIAEAGVTVHIANDNCPNQVVAVAGAPEAAIFLEQAGQRGIFVEKLPYDRGYHTPTFTYICEPLREFFSALNVCAPKVPVYSCTRATPYPPDPAQILDLVSTTFAEPLLFRQTVEAMYEAGARTFIEAGPRGNLTAFVDDILRDRPHLAVPMDQFRRSGLVNLLHAIGMLAASHVPLDVRMLYQRRKPRKLTWDIRGDTPADEAREPGALLISTCYPRLEPPAPLERPEHRPAASTLDGPGKAVAAAVSGIASGGSGSLSFIVEESQAVPRNSPLQPTDARPETVSRAAAPATILDDHFAIMEEFLSTHEAVIRTFLGAPAPAAAPTAQVSSAAPAESAQAAVYQPAPTGEALPVTQERAAETLREVLLRVVSERTGYPAEMLNLDLDLEADLGIDSIKRVEILGALRQRSEGPGFLPEVDMEQISRLKKLRQVLESLEAARPREEKPAPLASKERRGLTRASLIVSHTPGQSLTMHCDLSAEEHAYLGDHCLYFEASEFGDQGPRLVSMPMTGSLEIMAEAASILCPGLKVIGAKNMQALKWVNVETGGPPTPLVIGAHRTGNNVRVTMRRPEPQADLLAEATIVVDERYPEPPAGGRPKLTNARAPECTGPDIYTTRRMFHGPSFQGIESIEQIGDNGLTGRLRVLSTDGLLRTDRHPQFHIDPFLLDAAGQMVGYWPVENLAEGFVALPIRIEEITLYRDVLPPGESVGCRVHIKEVTRRQLKADLDVVADGQLWMVVNGWEDWRFYWERHIYEFWRFPNRAPNGREIKLPALAGEAVEIRRIDALGETDKTGLWENLWMHMILNRRELGEYESMRNAQARTEWIFVTAAAKDAARMWASKQDSKMPYPADIELVSDGADLRPIHRGEGRLPRYISVAYAGSAGVAAASNRNIAIAMESFAGNEWDARGACARKAAARLSASDDIETFAITEVDRASGRIIVTPGNSATSASIIADTALDGDRVIAVAHA